MLRIGILISLAACQPGLETAVPDAGAQDAGGEAFAAPVMVLRVIDGDTLEVRTEGGEDRLRLKGVDTPELGRRGEPAEPLAEEAKAHIQGRVGIKIGVEFDRACGPNPFTAEACRDGYDRLLCYVRLDDGADLNEELVRLGYAQVFRMPNERFDRQFVYEEAEAAARQERLGIWGP